MSLPSKMFSVRMPHELYEHLSGLAAARRQTPAELARTLIEAGLKKAQQIDDEEASSTKKQKRESDTVARLARAAIFAELMLTQFGHEDPTQTERILQKADEEAAALLGRKLALSSEAAAKKLEEEQRLVAERLAAG